MTPSLPLLRDLLRMNLAEETTRIDRWLHQTVLTDLRRRGGVLGLSGGIDSTVVAALAVRALGKERVVGLLMPEVDSSAESLPLGQSVASWLGIESRVEDVSPILQAAGCYRRRDDAIRELVPEYREGFKCKLVTSDPMSGSPFSISSLVVQGIDGIERKRRLTAATHLAIVAATNFKQRVRKMMEYYYADRFGYAVIGTPNKLEYDLGFFVKNGDGAADVKPIAHLYKSQVYALAAYLGVPETILRRPPTTDTFSLPQSQEEFFFSLPYQEMDLCLYARNHGLPVDAVAAEIGLTAEQVDAVFRMIDSKRRAAHYLQQPPLFVNPAGVL